MFRPLICIFALSLTSALYAEDLPPIETQTASIVEAIKQGQFDSRFSDEVELSSSQIAEISKLVGCTPQRKSPQGLWFMEFSWHCGEDTSYSGYSIATSWLFDQKSELVGFAINPTLEDLRPSSKATEAKSQEPKSKFANRFAEAVAKGDDYTLSGYLIFSQYENERLARLEGSEYSVSIGGSNGARSIKFWDSDNMLHQARMHFDDEGRAIGLTFKPGPEKDYAGRSAASDRRDSYSKIEKHERLNRIRESERRYNGPRSSRPRSSEMPRKYCPPNC